MVAKNLYRASFRTLLGDRLPLKSGRLNVKGVGERIQISRDQWGIPHIEAQSEADAWFGLGFCHAQDRCFQIDLWARVFSGRLSEWLGKKGLAYDRIARRIGFYRSAKAQYALCTPAIQASLKAYSKGVNAGRAQGFSKRPHEYVILRAQPDTHRPEDPLGVLAMMSFLLPSNWDSELVRLMILQEDGPQALRDLHAAYPAGHLVTNPPGKKAGKVDVSGLLTELEKLGEVLGLGGGSNNWVLSGKKTKSGKPILANDPHLMPQIPSQWYLAHLKTPEWEVRGAGLVGTPGIVAGHNQYGAWGVTAGLVDNTDLFIEEPSAITETLREEIKVRNSASVIEEIGITPRGPIVSPAFEGRLGTLSMGATWLGKQPISGILETHRTKNFEEFRACFKDWASLPLNFVYADTKGNIGWQLVGRPPVRKSGDGLIPRVGKSPNVGWQNEWLPYEEMPFAKNPESGFLATANNRPTDTESGKLSEDWIAGYRLNRICEELENKSDWDVASSLHLQLDVRSLAWIEIRNSVLNALTGEAIADSLQSWDGVISGDSWEATVFEFFLDEMARRAIAAKAPRSVEWAMGKSLGGDFTNVNWFGLQRVGWIAELIVTQPDSWFEKPWKEIVREVMTSVLKTLEKKFGADRKRWEWGEVRKIHFQHLFGQLAPLRPIFNLEPMKGHGDAHTVCQVCVDPRNILAPPLAVAGFRMAIDLADFSSMRMVLATGQSGNPFSPHYSDHHELWKKGEAFVFPMSGNEVLSLNPSA